MPTLPENMENRIREIIHEELATITWPESPPGEPGPMGATGMIGCDGRDASLWSLVPFSKRWREDRRRRK